MYFELVSFNKLANSGKYSIFFFKNHSPYSPGPRFVLKAPICLNAFTDLMVTVLTAHFSPRVFLDLRFSSSFTFSLTLPPSPSLIKSLLFPLKGKVILKYSMCLHFRIKRKTCCTCMYNTLYKCLPHATKTSSIGHL